MAQIVDVRDLNVNDIRALDRQRTAIILPGGNLEEHGPHLPIYSDGWLNEYTTRQLAEAVVARPGWKVVIFPVIPLGSGGANELGLKHSFPGTFAVRPATLRAVYLDLADELGQQGFRCCSTRATAIATPTATIWCSSQASHPLLSGSRTISSSGMRRPAAKTVFSFTPTWWKPVLARFCDPRRFRPGTWLEGSVGKEVQIEGGAHPLFDEALAESQAYHPSPGWGPASNLRSAPTIDSPSCSSGSSR